MPRGSQSVLGVPYLASAAENAPVVFVDVVDPTLGTLEMVLDGGGSSFCVVFFEVKL